MGTVHLVATPIGNLEDVTLRALRLLGEAELVLAEDTRRTRILLERHGVRARPLSLHAHNEAARIGKALAVLEGGGSVALVSDAGTPLISDPGERLVAAALEAGHAVSPVPGPSAVLSALAVSGLPCTPFTFLGFLPRRAGPRDALLAGLRDRPETLVLFESPRRAGATLRRLAEVFGERRACLARELTKRYEQVVRGPLDELAERFAEGARGEVTIVVEGAAAPRPVTRFEDLDDAIRARIAAGETSRQIAAALARDARLPKRDVYARAVALRDRS
ncbi:MAG: 16S rRNA (cytidine(1402)-2'-O)-methyltransferase [Myxococcota bacterium]